MSVAFFVTSQSFPPLDDERIYHIIIELLLTFILIPHLHILKLANTMQRDINAAYDPQRAVRIGAMQRILKALPATPTTTAAAPLDTPSATAIDALWNESLSSLIPLRIADESEDVRISTVAIFQR